MNQSVKILVVALGTGVLGWTLENVLFGPRYSYFFPNIPFLPVYAVGGAAIAILEPHVQNVSPLGRAIIYGGTLTAIEGLAGTLERADGRKSWDYDGYPIDVSHAILWASLGLLAEGVVSKIS